MKRHTIVILLALLSSLWTGASAVAQLGPSDFAPPANSTNTAGPASSPNSFVGPSEPADSGDGMNPISILAKASEALPGSASGSGSGSATSGSSERGKTGLSTAINIVVVLTVIGLVPSIMLMCTCFVRIVIVLGLLKQALGAAQMPPSQVMLGLALIMTMLVMAPTVDRIHAEAVVPYQQGKINDYQGLWNAGKQPLRDFMFAQIEHTKNWSSVYMILNYRGVDTSDPTQLKRSDVDMLTLIPAFVLSELKVAFLMGFRVYLPFLVIDMVISALLISMSMMMLPPVLISLPFKLLLFVLVDGWQLVCGSLMQSFVSRAPTVAYAEQLCGPEGVRMLVAVTNDLGAMFG